MQSRETPDGTAEMEPFPDRAAGMVRFELEPGMILLRCSGIKPAADRNSHRHIAHAGIIHPPGRRHRRAEKRSAEARLVAEAGQAGYQVPRELVEFAID